MAENDEVWIQSFVNEKRPALEGIVEDIIGPQALMDEVVLGKPLPPEDELFQTMLRKKKR